MKVIKPQRLGVTHRLYVHDGQPRLAVAVLVLFPFEQPDRLLPEVALWKLVATEPTAMPLDEGMNKSSGEVVVHGSCFTPRAEPLGVCAARVAMGSIDKTVYAVGDRVWHHGAPTTPAPFTVMPLRWERAFGGEGFASNPLGKGFAGRGVDGAPLPNVEAAGHLIRSSTDLPVPAGFGPIDASLPQRHAKLGTYDARWLATRFPGFAEDIDWTAFHVVSPDQRIDGFFAPGTPFVVEHMHPDEPRQESRLPDVKVRCFANRRGADGAERFDEVATHVDTVHLFPHLGRGIAVHRGVISLDEEDAEDLLQLVLAAERPDTPRPVSHYRDILRERLDPPNPAVLLRESGLLPPQPDGAALPEERSEMRELLARDKLLRRNQRQGAQKRIDALRADLESRGMDASDVHDLSAPEPPVAREDLAERVDALREQARAEREASETKREAALARVRELGAKHGIDVDAKLAEAQTRRGGPPAFSAAEQWERLRKAKQVGDELGVTLPDVDAKLADPELGIQLHLVEQKLRDAYRRTAHLQAPVAPLDEARALELRDDLVLRITAGIALEGRDLTGADLSGLLLAGADLSGACLEGADLRGADLTNAKLDRAVLARAKLDGVCLEGASMLETNLGGASLVGARAKGADFSRAELTNADLSGADLRGAALVGARLHGAKLAGIDGTGLRAGKVRLLDADIRGAVLRDAVLERALFLRCRLDGVDFSGATLTSATFLAGSADGALFRGARLDNLRVVRGASFARADFRGARLGGANLRATPLAGADFTGARLEGADVSGADLSDAKLVRVDARGARFTRTRLTGADLREADLREASLAHAKVARADFSRANLFRADLGRMAGDDHTSFEGALLTRVRVLPPRPRVPEEKR